ncbi:sugar phosphate isomerase/epimerase [Candidatus Bipolaricaulota bacterium]|nr:sugar phosphate isomerase/epimerase [Candidatus Bipolaricaulota bacterium]
MQQENGLAALRMKGEIAFGIALETFFYGCSPLLRPSIEQAVHAILDRQLGVELWAVRGPHDENEMTSSQIKKVGNLCQNAPFVTMHSRYSLWTWAPALLMKEIKLCSDLGASSLVLHRETLGLNQPGDLLRDKEVLEIAEYAKQRNVFLLLENVPDSMWALDEVLGRIGENPEETNIGICIDVGHANISTDAGGNPIHQYIQRYRRQLHHVHFSDNHGDKDAHLPPGQGMIDWISVFALLADVEYSGACVLEIHPSGDVGQAIDETIKFLHTSKLEAHSRGARESL